MVLIAGHTHHPVWEGMGLQQTMTQLRDQDIGSLTDSAWLQDQVEGAVTLPAKKPCYFNALDATDPQNWTNAVVRLCGALQAGPSAPAGTK